MTGQKGKGYQEITATVASEYENARSDFNYCYDWGKWKTMSDYFRDTRVPQGPFPDKVAPDIDGFIDEPVV